MAVGDVLAFVDADSRIHPETFNAIERTLASGRVIVGATGFRYDRMSLAMWIQFVPATILLHLARLDTGVMFCRRADWQAVGGFEEHRLVAEDIQFQTAMKKLGRTRGQRFGRARGARTPSSARKFDRYGDWHYVTNAFRAGRWLLTGRGSFAGFIQCYWYEERR